MSINWTNEWHRRACPTPDQRAFDVQLGCHVEEFVEMLEELEIEGATVMRLEVVMWLTKIADALKAGNATATIRNRKELLDSLADQIVTSTGVGYRAGMNIPKALLAVDCSNWSKFDEYGSPIFDANGKIMKGPNYAKPNLEGLY